MYHNEVIGDDLKMKCLTLKIKYAYLKQEKDNLIHQLLRKYDEIVVLNDNVEIFKSG